MNKKKERRERELSVSRFSLHLLFHLQKMLNGSFFYSFSIEVIAKIYKIKSTNSDGLFFFSLFSLSAFLQFVYFLFRNIQLQNVLASFFSVLSCAEINKQKKKKNNINNKNVVRKYTFIVYPKTDKYQISKATYTTMLWTS